MTIKQRAKYQDQIDELHELRSDVKLLEYKVKEKDQELKLSEMKIKELRKSIPHLQLKPLRSKSRASTMQARIS